SAHGGHRSGAPRSSPAQKANFRAADLIESSPRRRGTMARMTATTSPKVGVARMRPFGTTIFAEMSALAARTGAVNLGQGFPDTDGPPEMLAAAAEALRSGRNQYPPGPGIPELRAAVAAHQRRFSDLEH